jgi:hypothetical protein
VRRSITMAAIRKCRPINLPARYRNVPGPPDPAPDGQITHMPVHPLRQKYFSFPQTQITGLSTAVPSLLRGVSRSSRTWGGMWWTRVALLTNSADADGEAVWS